MPCLLAGSYAGGPETDAIRILQRKLNSKDVETQLNELEKLPDVLKTETFDPKAKAAGLGHDAGKIFEFVRAGIRLEIYSGVLRGPRGTLMAGAGNAYDKCLLLIEMLRAQGFTCRFARAHLPAEAAEKLIAQMFVPVANITESNGGPKAEQNQSAQALLDLTFGRRDANLELIQATLDESGVKFPDNSALSRAQLSREASDHVWVEYEQGQNWVALDPATIEAKPGTSPASAEETFSDLPSDLYQKITLSVSIEERAESGTTTREVLHHVATAAELNGSPVSLHFETSVADGRWSANPVLKFGDTKTGQSTSFSSTVSGTGASNLAAGLFRKPGALPRSTASNPGISALWLDLEFSAPSVPIEKIRRTLFDRVENRTASGPPKLLPMTESGGIPRALRAVFGLSFDCGQIAIPSLVSQLHAAIPQLRAAVATKEVTSSSPAMLMSMQLMASSFHVLSDIFLDMARKSAAPKQVLIYSDRPRLVIVDSGDVALRFPSNAITSDVRQNRVRVVLGDGAGQSMQSVNISCGVLDGALESELFGDLLGPRVQRESISLSRVLRGAKADKVPLVAVRSISDLQNIDVPEFARIAMRDALDKHNVLVTPMKCVVLHGHKRTGWWQINLDTGLAMAAMDTGLFETTSESVTLESILETIWFSKAFTIFGVVAFVIYVGFMITHDWSLPCERCTPGGGHHFTSPEPWNDERGTQHTHDNPYGP